MPSAYQVAKEKPLSGLLETRVLPDAMTPDMWRFRENWQCDENGRVIRGRGFSAYGQGNADYHDQLLPLQNFYAYQNPRVAGDTTVTPLPNSSVCGNTLLTRANGREPVNFLFQAAKTTGIRRLLAGTPSRLAVLDETTSNWRILADGLGNVTTFTPKWKAATLNSTVVFTNGVDTPLAWPIDGAAQGCQMQSAFPITDLAKIGVTNAGFVISFNGLMILMDVTMGGKRFPTRIVWSDEDLPQTWTPQIDQVPGFADLPNSDGDQILGAVALGSALYVFTMRGIYRGVPTGSIPVLDFSQQLYGDEGGAKCIAFRNSLCAFGAYMFYAGFDGFYVYNPYQMEPERVAWMHSASGIVYNGNAVGYSPIDPSLCDVHVAAFRPDSDANAQPGQGEIWFSYAEVGSLVPSKTIILNTRYNFASTMDCGFGALVNYVSDKSISVRDWLLTNCLMSPTDLANNEIGFQKEAQPSPAIVCPAPGRFIPTCIYTASVRPWDGTGIDTEDFTLPQADATSLCALLGGITPADICESCRSAPAFIGASSIDFCLKQIGGVYSRELCTNTATPTGPGTPYVLLDTIYNSFPAQYETVGYNSRMRGAPQDFGTRTQKNIKRVRLDVDADPQVNPCVIALRIGTAYNPADPNTAPNTVGGVLWWTAVRQLLQQTDGMTPEQLIAQNLVPNLGTEFALYVSGYYLYWEIMIAGLSDPTNINSMLVPAIGGSSRWGALFPTIREISPLVRG